MQRREWVTALRPSITRAAASAAHIASTTAKPATSVEKGRPPRMHVDGSAALASWKAAATLYTGTMKGGRPTAPTARATCPRICMSVTSHTIASNSREKPPAVVPPQRRATTLTAASSSRPPPRMPAAACSRGAATDHAVSPGGHTEQPEAASSVLLAEALPPKAPEPAAEEENLPCTHAPQP